MRHHRSIIVSLLLVLFLVPATCYSKTLHPEKYYRDLWCDDHNGTTEYRLQDGTVSDCITSTHIVELEFASGWYESVAQSLHYAMLSGQKAAVVLIIEKQSDQKYWNRLVALKKFYKLPITLWRIYP